MVFNTGTIWLVNLVSPDLILDDSSLLHPAISHATDAAAISPFFADNNLMTLTTRSQTELAWRWDSVGSRGNHSRHIHDVNFTAGHFAVRIGDGFKVARDIGRTP